MEWRGLRPAVGVVVPGSGAAVGFSWRLDRALRLPFDSEIEGMISARNYHHLALRVGAVDGASERWELAPSSAALHNFYEAATKPVQAAGPAVYLEASYSRLPALSLFGVPRDRVTVVESDFGQRLIGADVVLHWQRTARWAMGARVGWLRSDGVAAGNPDTPNADVAFARTDALPGTSATFVPIGAGVAYGTFPLTSPARAAAVTAAVWHFASLSATVPSFTRVEAAALASRQVGPAPHVLAGRLTGSAVAGDVPMPFRHTLGGSNTMRGYDSYRLRANRLLTATVESRWRVWKALEVVPFVEAAITGGHAERLGDRGVLPSAGVGARWRLTERFVFRTDLAVGRDGRRVLLTVGQPF